MQTSPGITVPKFSRDPLGTEGEMTVGPDNVNPYNSPDEKEIVDQIRAKQREQAKADTKVVRTTSPFDFELRSPTEGDDPFIFDDIDRKDVHDVQLPFANGLDPSGFEL